MKQGMDIEEFAREIKRRDEAKRDYVVDTRRMHFVTGSPDHEGIPIGQSEIDLIGPGSDDYSSGLKVNELFHEQLSGRLRIPRAYYERIRYDYPDVLDYSVNKLLHGASEKRLVRTLDGTARAYLSDKYLLRRDNHDIAKAVFHVLANIPDVRIASSALTDRRMYIKATTPRVTGYVKVGDEVCAGVYLGNSEVGCGALEIYPFIMRKVCDNGMIVKRQFGMRKVHLGKRIESDEENYAIFSESTLRLDDEAFFAKCEDVVRAAVSEVNFRDLVEQMTKAAQDAPVEDPVAAVRVLAKKEKLDEDESRDILKFLATGNDLSRWGMLNAVTRAAGEANDYDRASDLEAVGGRVLDYVPADWKPIAQAVS